MPRPRSNAVSGPSAAPALGSHRSRSPMIGNHRQQQDPVLGMQQAVGNQATQQTLSDGYTEVEQAEAEYTEVYSDPVTQQTPSDGYTEVEQAEAAPAPASLATPTPASAPLPAGYSAYTAYRGPAGASEPQVSSSGSVDVEGIADQSVEDQPNNPEFTMQPMGPGMEDFDTSLLGRANPHMGTSMPSTTFYADTPDKRAPYTRSFDSQGKMSSATNGSTLNTIGAERPAAIGAKGDRHIFAMDGQGQFHTADAIKENKQRGQAAAVSGATQQERFHHSSFLAGKDVAGAGEMQVRDGQVELVSDTSGHYMPGSKQMMQTVQQLEKNKVTTEKLGVEFVGKPIMDQFGNSTGRRTENMQASATELLGYQDHSPETAEIQMRSMHDKKNSFLGELLGKSQNNPEGHNLKPSELNRRPEAAAPEAPVAQEQEQAEAENEEILYNSVEDFQNLNSEDEGSELEAEDNSGFYKGEEDEPEYYN